MNELELKLKEIKLILKELVKLDEMTEEFSSSNSTSTTTTLDCFKNSESLVNSINSILPINFNE